MIYLSDTARTRTRNLFHHKCTDNDLIKTLDNRDLHRHWFLESAFLLYSVHEVASIDKLHDKVESILKMIWFNEIDFVQIRILIFFLLFYTYKFIHKFICINVSQTIRWLLSKICYLWQLVLIMKRFGLSELLEWGICWLFIRFAHLCS